MSRKILAVDDEPDILELIEMEIEELGHTLICADVKSAFALFEKNRDIDLIISDFKMPNLTGLDFYKMVRGIDEEIPYIIFSGNLESDDFKVAGEKRGLIVVSKPNIAELREEVERILGEREP